MKQREVTHRSYLDALERRLSEAEHLCDDYSLADIATWLCLTFAQTLGVALGERAGVQGWYQRIGARPAVAREIEGIMAAAAAA